MGELPEDIIKKLPQYPSVPAVLLGRLALDRSIQKKGYGELLLVDSIRKCLNNPIGSMAMVVDAKDANAKSFYQRYGFKRFPSQPYRLFLPFSTIKKLTF